MNGRLLAQDLGGNVSYTHQNPERASVATQQQPNQVRIMLGQQFSAGIDMCKTWLLCTLPTYDLDQPEEIMSTAVSAYEVSLTGE